MGVFDGKNTLYSTLSGLKSFKSNRVELNLIQTGTIDTATMISFLSGIPLFNENLLLFSIGKTCILPVDALLAIGKTQT